MKILYLENNTGASGDMLNSALFELLTDEEKKHYLEKMNSLFPGKLEVKALRTDSDGICGSRIEMLIDGEKEGEASHNRESHYSKYHEHHHTHSHHSLKETLDEIDSFNLEEEVKINAKNVYNIIGAAESKVHEKEISEIHLHEVGNIDAVADVTGVALLISMIGPDKIVSDVLPTGTGIVKCSHGILPVPAPATAEILKGIPTCEGGIEEELTTPTGAALIKYFANEFGPRPEMKIIETGYGIGHKKLSRANILRAFYGESKEEDYSDTITELNINIDDMTPEDIAFAENCIFEAGAVEVFGTPVYMKKGRMAQMLTVLVHKDKEEAVVKAIFHNTTTIGIRKKVCQRYIMKSSFNKTYINGHKLVMKDSKGYGEETVKPEFDDLANISKEIGIPLKELRKEIRR